MQEDHEDTKITKTPKKIEKLVILKKKNTLFSIWMRKNFFHNYFLI
mgnify:CR=1 FL=1